MDVPKIDRLPEVRRKLLGWHREHGMRAPWRESGDPYQALVAAVMAQQTQMSRVMPSYRRFMAAFPTVESLAEASPGKVIRVWVGMGYNQRAVRLHRAGRAIAADGWPRDAAGLAQIEGIGPFTAAIVASFAFGQPAACVDTNVRRVLGRLAGNERLSERALEALADTAIDRDEPARWNQALMDYGARVCVPRPRCDECVVARQCASRGTYARPLQQVAEERAQYETGSRTRKKAKESRYEGSARFFRGRIVDALRALEPGRSIVVTALPEMIANGHAAPSHETTRELVEALERAGLVVVRRGRVALPE